MISVRLIHEAGQPKSRFGENPEGESGEIGVSWVLRQG